MTSSRKSPKSTWHFSTLSSLLIDSFTKTRRRDSLNEFMTRKWVGFGEKAHSPKFERFCPALWRMLRLAPSNQVDVDRTSPRVGAVDRVIVGGAAW
jgi:hypothetical protein